MRLERQPSTPNGTFGEWFLDDGSHLCFTVELPWLDNEPDKSCIPCGTWEFNKYISPKHGNVWRAHGIPDRSEIEVHPANWARQLLGCIAPGDAIGMLEGVPAVLNSDETFAMLLTTLPDKFFLTITEE